MKKVMYMLALSIFCFLSLESFAHIFFSGSLFAVATDEGEMPVLTVNEGGSGNGPTPTDDSCSYIMNYTATDTIRLANLDQSGNSGDYPAGVPVMYLRVRIDDGYGNTVYEQHPLLDWTYMGDYGDYNEPTFYTVVDIDITMESDCPLNGFTVVHTLDKYVGTLVEPSGFLPYPICDYNDPREILSCHVFNNIPCDDEIVGSCHSKDYHFYYGSGNGVFPVDCSSCVYTYFKTEKPSNEEGKTEIQLSTSANPFQDQLTIYWEGNKRERLTLRLYNSVGQLMKSTQQTPQSGNVLFDTSSWANGIYFLEAFDGETRQLIKLVK